MGIRQRVKVKEPKPVTMIDATVWSNDELAAWAEGRAYEISKKLVSPTGYAKDEHDLFSEIAVRLRRA